MHDVSEQVALVGGGEHEQDDDEATLAPRKYSREESANGSWKPYGSALHGNANRHTSRGSYASLVDEA